MDKNSVMIMHPTSLPDIQGLGFGIGELGSGTYEWIQFLAEAGFSYWLMNPFGHTGYGNSPYQTFSRFAGSPYLVSIERLHGLGDLTRSEVADYAQAASHISPDNADFGWLFRNKVGGSADDDAILRTAFERAMGKPERRDELAVFSGQQAFWLDQYADFMALKEMHNHRPWPEWDDGYRDIRRWQENKTSMLERSPELANLIDFYRYTQMAFFENWGMVRGVAQLNGIRIIGDLPWYVGLDSADVWANPGAFKLDDLRPIVVAGVPPDYFSETGQLWGNPVYDWDSKDAFRFWERSISFLLDHFDLLRIDHARAIDTHWEIPKEHAEQEGTAVKGWWAKGPGEALMNIFYRATGADIGDLPMIFEDLGYLLPVFAGSYPDDIPEGERYSIHPAFARMIKAQDMSVQDGLLPRGGYNPRIGLDEIMARHALPWMGVAQFMNDPRLHPENWPYECVGFTGTHDNDTTLGWIQSQEGDMTVYDLIEMVLGSQARIAGFPWQDAWELGSEARFNLPGDMRPGGWWTARLTRAQFEYGKQEILPRLHRLNEQYGRSI